MVRGTSRHLPRILLQTYGGRQWASELDVRSDAYCARPPRSAASGPPHEPQSPYTPHRRPRSLSPLPMKTARPPALRPATVPHHPPTIPHHQHTSPANSLPREHQPRPYRSGPPFAPRTTHPPCRVGVARHRRPRGRDRDPIPTILAPAAAGHCSCHSARLAQSVLPPPLLSNCCSTSRQKGRGAKRCCSESHRFWPEIGNTCSRPPTRRAEDPGHPRLRHPPWRMLLPLAAVSAGRYAKVTVRAPPSQQPPWHREPRPRWTPCPILPADPPTPCDLFRTTCRILPRPSPCYLFCFTCLYTMLSCMLTCTHNSIYLMRAPHGSRALQAA